MAKMKSPFQCPVRCTAGYPTYPSGKPHGGEDYVPKDKEVESNWTLYSTCDGTVYVSKKQSGSFPGGYGAYGNYLVIQATNGYWVLMAHMKSKPIVKVGERVCVGEEVGVAGATGNVSGRHLHIEVSDMRGVKYNSATWYDEFCKHRVKPSDYIDFDNYNPDEEDFCDMKDWKNGSTIEKVYATDTDAASKGAYGAPIRILPPRYTAKCMLFRTVAGVKVYAIEYVVPETTAHENGYVLYSGGVKP